jgi:hypothetical protein
MERQLDLRRSGEVALAIGRDEETEVSHNRH